MLKFDLVIWSVVAEAKTGEESDTSYIAVDGSGSVSIKENRSRIEFGII